MKPLLLIAAVAASAVLAGCGNPRGSQFDDCWVKVYDEESFTWGDDRAKIWGPAEFPGLDRLPDAGDKYWGDDIESIKVGPAARVFLYSERNYLGDRAEFGPGARVPDLDAWGMGDRASSMRIEYVGD